MKYSRGSRLRNDRTEWFRRETVAQHPRACALSTAAEKERLWLRVATRNHRRNSHRRVLMRNLSNSTAHKNVAFLTDHFHGYFHFRVILFLLILLFGELRDQVALNGTCRGVSSTMEPEKKKKLFLKYLFSKIFFQLLVTMLPLFLWHIR